MFTSNVIPSTVALIAGIAGLLIFSLITIITKKKSNDDIKFEIAACIVILAGAVLLFVTSNFLFFGVSIFIYSALTFFAGKKSKPVEEEIENEPLEAVQEVEEPVFDPEEDAEKQMQNEVLKAGRDFMVKASESFSDSDGLLKLLDTINKSVIDITKSDGGAILLIDEFDDIITVKTFTGTFPPPYQLPQDLPHKIARVETSFRFAQFPLGETIFGIAATTGKAELITDPLNDSRIFQNEPEDFLKLGSYIIIPMIVKGTVIGVLALARKFESPKFNETDFSNAQILTDFASCAIQNVFSYQEIAEHSELTKESEIACQLQKNMHAKTSFTIPGASFGCFFTGTEGVCGDYFDVIPCRKDRIAFVLADVAGKGMNSLIVMVMIRAIMQLVVNTQKTAATILTWTNRGITGKINIDHFASLVLANYDSENKKMQIATAGNAPGLIYHESTKEIEALQITSDPIGVDKATVYTDIEFPVEPGDIIVLYTDGLVEAVDANSRQYGVDNIKSLIKENANLKATDISTKIKKSLKEFCGSAKQHDDQTLLVIKIQ
ncbi:MAG: SpoIIE family protein phosphatase [Spirochaetaceae bacterium]|nr:SpoIIE family protein phosphatase [Spirochaetaceae bacterium]